MSRHRRSRSPLIAGSAFLIEALEGRKLLAADPLTVIVGAGAAKSVQFTDAGGTQAQVLLKGAGVANVTFDGTDLSQSANAKGLVVSGSGISITGISINATTAQSIFQIITKSNHALSIGSIMIGGALNSLLAPSVTVTGDVSSGSGVHLLQLAGATGGTISIGDGKVGTLGVQIGSVSNEGFSTLIPITTLTASQWVNTVGEGLSLNAPQIGSISIAHDFTSDLTAASVNSMSVKGNLSNSTINLTTPLTATSLNLSSLKVGGGIVNTVINAGGSIGSITAARMIDSAVYAGLVAVPSGPFPSATTDFRNTAIIKSVTLKKSASASFSNSIIAAYNLGSATLGTVSQANNSVPFGLAAHDVKSVTIIDLGNGKSVHVANPPTTTAFDNALVSRGVTPADFEVRIV